MSTKTGYIKNSGPQGAAFDDGPHIGGVIKFVCTRSPETSKNVSVTAYYYLGFGSYAASGISYTGYKVTIYAGDNTWSSSTHPSKVINSSGTNWSCTSNSTEYFSAHDSDSNIDVKTKPARKTGTIGSWTISNGTSGSRTFKFQMDDNGLQDTYTVSIATPTYNPNITATVVSADTSMGTVTGGGTWAPGTAFTITATPKAGYKFKQGTYSDGGSGSNPNASVSFASGAITTSGKATASFESYYVKLRYNVNGGTVTTATSGTERGRATSAGRLQRSTDSGSTGADVTHNVYTYNKAGDGTTNMGNVGTPPIKKTGYSVVGTSAGNTKADGTGINLNQDYSTSSTTNAVTAYRLNGNAALTSNITVDVYPKGVINTWNVHFDGNGATSGSMSDQTHTRGVDLALTANAFQRTGYTFYKWQYTNSSNGNVYEYDDRWVMPGTWAGASATGVTYTLYALGNPTTTNVTFNPNGGSLDNNGNGGSDANTTNSHTCTLTYDSSNYYAQGKATRTNYAFEGGNTKADGTGYNVYGANGTCTTSGGYWSAAGSSGKWRGTGQTLTLYAKWRIKSTTWNAVTTNTKFGTVTGSGTYNYGSTITLTATPKSGFEFAQGTFYRDDTSTSAGNSSNNPWTAAASNYPDNSIYTATANGIPITDATIVDNNTGGQAENQWNNMNNMGVQRGEGKPVISAGVLIDGVGRVVFGAGLSDGLNAQPIDSNASITMSIDNHDLNEYDGTGIRNKTDDDGGVFIDYNQLYEFTDAHGGTVIINTENYGTITADTNGLGGIFYGTTPFSTKYVTSTNKNIRINTVIVNGVIGLQFLIN